MARSDDTKTIDMRTPDRGLRGRIASASPACTCMSELKKVLNVKHTHRHDEEAYYI